MQRIELPNYQNEMNEFEFLLLETPIALKEESQLKRLRVIKVGGPKIVKDNIKS